MWIIIAIIWLVYHRSESVTTLSFLQPPTSDNAPHVLSRARQHDFALKRVVAVTSILIGVLTVPIFTVFLFASSFSGFSGPETLWVPIPRGDPFSAENLIRSAQAFFVAMMSIYIPALGTKVANWWDWETRRSVKTGTHPWRTSVLPRGVPLQYLVQ